MSIVLFVLGALIFVGLGVLMIISLANEGVEDIHYLTVGYTYAMSTLVFIYCLFGGSVFNDIVQNWIIFATSVLIICWVFLYIIGYLAACSFDIKLLLVLPIVVLEVWQLVYKWPWGGVLRDSTFLVEIIALLWGISCTAMMFFGQRTNSHDLNLQMVKKYENTYRHSKYFNDDLTGQHEDASEDVTSLVLNLYRYAKNNDLNSIYTNEFFTYYFRKTLLDKRVDIYKRLADFNLSNNINSMNAIEFASILLPEVFGNPKRTNSSVRYDLRLYDEYYNQLQHNMSRSTLQNEEIISKLDKLLYLKLETLSAPKKIGNQEKNINSVIENQEYGQSIIREVNHLTKTPLLTISMAIKNLTSNPDAELSGFQQEKINIIMDNMLTVKLIIEAYRNLVTLSDAMTKDNIVSHLKTAIASINDTSKKRVKSQISDFPDTISVHGNNVIIILLLPLIHNAIDASPNGAEIIIKYTDHEDNAYITIENKCDILPTQSNLDTNGYTTKTDGGEGLRSVRRIAKSIGMKFQIKVYTKERKVVATLIIPKN